ncbi:MAG: YlbF family regulator [Phycisphaeraceae bacterium]
MATTQDIQNAARELGKLIATHEAAVKFEATLKKLDADIEAQRVLNDYNRHLTMIAQKEQNSAPIEVEDKRKLEQLHNQVVQNPLLREFQVAQMDYVDLMRGVEEAMAGRPAAAPNVAATSPLVNPDLSGK